jgi:hypothetical protein
MTWTKVNSTENYRSYQCGDYHAVTEIYGGRASNWSLSHRGQYLGTYATLKAAKAAAAAHA